MENSETPKFNPAEEIINYVCEIIDIVSEVGYWNDEIFEITIGNAIDCMLEELINLPHAKHVVEALYKSDEDGWLNYNIGNPPFNFTGMAEEVLKWKREKKICDYDFMRYFMALYSEGQWCTFERGDGNELDPYYILELTEQEMRDIQEEYKSMVKLRCKSKERRKEILSKIREMEQEGKLWSPEMATETSDGEIYEICGKYAGEVIKDLLTNFDEKKALNFMWFTPDAVGDPCFHWSNFSAYFAMHNYEEFLVNMFPSALKISGKEILEAIRKYLMGDFAEKMAFRLTEGELGEHKAMEAIKKLNEQTEKRLLNGKKNEGK